MGTIRKTILPLYETFYKLHDPRNYALTVFVNYFPSQ